MRTRNGFRLTGILASLLLSPGLASGTTVFSFTGTFLQDDLAETFAFTVGSSASVTLRSFGYAGGTNGVGATIVAGGFDSYFSVFNASGTLILQNNDGTGVPADSSTGNPFDAALFAQPLGAGSYTLVLTQFDNVPAGGTRSAGFTKTGQGNFTCPEFVGSPGSFCDQGFDQRNGKWAVDISGVLGASDTTAGVPEPGTVFLLGSAAAALFFVKRRRFTDSRDSRRP